MNGFLLTLIAESGVHAGGDEAVGTIDEPIQRDVISRYPVIHGQSLKGAERRLYRRSTGDRPAEVKAFGSEPPGEGVSGDHLEQGWLSVGEAVLAAFPVPTMRRTFAWVTSPLALSNIARLARHCDIGQLPEVPTWLAESRALVVPEQGWDPAADVGDYTIASESSPIAAAWGKWLAGRMPSSFAYGREKMNFDLLIVSDSLLSELTQEHVEVAARVQLHMDEKRVKHGPFFTEYLPRDTMMIAWHGTSSAGIEVVGRLRETLHEAVWSVGGDESIGKGLVWSTVTAKAAA